MPPIDVNSAPGTLETVGIKRSVGEEEFWKIQSHETGPSPPGSGLMVFLR